MKKFALAVHGGAGTIDPGQMTKELEREYKSALVAALEAGTKKLKGGQSALDAVEAAVISLEDCPLFNAGKGSVFNNRGKNEMDASIMCGESMKAGAVAGIKNIKNPITLSRAVMRSTSHVFLAGEGAEEFARASNFEFLPDDYFFTSHRYEQWLKIKDTDKAQLDHSVDKPIGTVGAVALDVNGNLAAATSTGGMTNKKFGRIGDTPIIGAGTYANNESCAVSSTGHGEYFIRNVVAFDISCLMEYRGLSLAEACDFAINHKLKRSGGDGGVIAVDNQGNIALIFNSTGMYRGAVSDNVELYTAIY